MGSIRRWEPGEGFTAALVFAIALPLLWLRYGHWFLLSYDEGIYLEGARRVAEGQAPYRDFFNITGPATFWLYGLVFHFFGSSFAAARAVLCVEMSACCALICWLIHRAGNAVFSFACALLYLAMLLTTVYPVYVAHRWDSNVFALAAAALAYQGVQRRDGRWLVMAGLLAGMAAWTTPPMLLVALAVAFWIGSASLPGLRGYFSGIAVISALALGALIYSGAVKAMVQALLWDAANYSAANRLGYGALTGTFESFRRQGSMSAAVVHYATSVLPALLPVLAALSVAFALWRTRGKSHFGVLSLVGAASLAALAACLPRLGAAQLLFAAAFFWTACGCAVSSLLSRRVQNGLALVILLVALGAGFAGWRRSDLRKIETPAGTLAVSRLHFVMLNDLLSAIHPGQSVFVYPYLPALYFVLGVHNPTRYAWLQPGMMSVRDEQNAVAELTARPPIWVVWHEMSDAVILKNWPSTDRNRLRFPAMEAFLQTNYHVVNPDGVVTTGFRLLEKNP